MFTAVSLHSQELADKIAATRSADGLLDSSTALREFSLGRGPMSQCQLFGVFNLHDRTFLVRQTLTFDRGCFSI